MIYNKEQYPELYKKVTDAFGNYILNTISKPNPVFNGMPPCPFAKAEWLKNKVDIIICDLIKTIEEGNDKEIGEIVDIMHGFNEDFNNKQNKSTLILVDYDNIVKGIEYDIDRGVDIAYYLEEFYIKYYPYKDKQDKLDIIGSNPKEPTVWGNLTPYMSILVQNSELLSKAIKTLDKAGYYQNLTKDDIVEGIADDPVYKGIKFKDGEGLGNDINKIKEDNNLYDQLYK